MSTLSKFDDKALQFQELVAMRYIEWPDIYLNPKKISNSLQLAPKYLLLSNQKTILKRGMAFTKKKPKDTTLKVQPYNYSHIY